MAHGRGPGPASQLLGPDRRGQEVREEEKSELTSEERAGEANQRLSDSLELPVESGDSTKNRPVVWQSVGLTRS